MIFSVSKSPHQLLLKHSIPCQTLTTDSCRTSLLRMKPLVSGTLLDPFSWIYFHILGVIVCSQPGAVGLSMTMTAAPHLSVPLPSAQASRLRPEILSYTWPLLRKSNMHSDIWSLQPPELLVSPVSPSHSSPSSYPSYVQEWGCGWEWRWEGSL